jgi:BlaI family transcriptional regulator, penicillinase repressor
VAGTNKELSDLQLALLQALWELTEGTVSDVQAVLERDGRKLAPTTVATVLRRLELQGWVTHREQGRHFLYRAAVSRQRAAGRILNRITSSLFGGDVPALVSQLLASHDVDRAELDELRRLIEETERRLK